MKRNNRIWIFSLITMGFTFLLTESCKKAADNNSTTAKGPVITTNAVTNITTKTATGGGNISSDGGTTIIGRGVCWSITQNPTVVNSTFDGSGIGSFTSSITGLTSNTTYYVRAYAANSSEIFYGNQVSFKTTIAGSNSLSATVDGVSYAATSSNVLTSSGKVGISGLNGTKNLILWLPDPFTTGSHSLSTFGDYMGQYASGSSIWTSSSGTINISEFNASTGKIKGTFNFVATDNSTTVTVTNGQFEVYK